MICIHHILNQDFYLGLLKSRRRNNISPNYISNRTIYLQSRQILSPIAQTTYKLCAVKGSFSFAKAVLEFDTSLFTVGFDMKSLFTNVILIETLNPCVQSLYRNQTHVGNLNKSSFYSLLKVTMFELFLIFDLQFYEHFDGAAMSSSLVPTLANIFRSHFENIWLENYPVRFKQSVYRQFVDDAFFEQRPNMTPLSLAGLIGLITL